MNSYKSYICQNSYEDDAMLLHICYICDKIICGKCNHTHNAFEKENNEILKQIVKDKGKITHDLILSFYDCDILGYSNNMNNYELTNFEEIEKNRKLIKQYIDIKCMGLCDFRIFSDHLLRLKIEFKYRLYKMMLSNYFCIDIIEVILSYL